MTVVPTPAGATLNVVRGIAADESGINVTKLDLEYRPEFKDFLLSRIGEKRLFAIGAIETQINIEGEVLLVATGLTATSFAVAATIANVIDGFGQTAGGVYADSIKLSFGNLDWKKFSGNFSRNAAIA